MSFNVPNAWIASLLVLAVPAFFCGAPALAQSASQGYTPPEATVQSALDYRIRQGDEVSLSVFGELTLTPTTPLHVLQGGTIAVPLAGNVVVGGLTTAQASDAVAKKLRHYLRDPKVTIAVVSVGPVEALVLGNVKTPRQIHASAAGTLDRRPRRRRRSRTDGRRVPRSAPLVSRWFRRNGFPSEAAARW